MAVIATDLLEKTRREKKKNISDEATDKSIIGLLRKTECQCKSGSELIFLAVKAEEEDAELHMNQTEVMAQVRSSHSFGEWRY